MLAEVTPAPPNRTYYSGFSGLRAVAFLMVFAQHYLDISWGWAGVDIFFVLSGFLITGILYEGRDKPHPFKTFYTRRVLRIFPLYYGVFAGLLLLTPLLGLRWSPLWLAWPTHLGNYLRNWPPTALHDPRVAYGVLLTRSARCPYLRLGHFWSLCIEEQFYLLWPLVVVNVRGRRVLIWTGVIAFTCMPLARLIMEHTLPLDAMHGLMGWSLPFRMDALLLGGSLVLWSGSEHGKKTMRSAKRVSVPFAAMVLVLGCLFLAGYDFLVPPGGRILTYTIVDGAALICIYEAAREHSLFCKALQWKPLAWAGGLSYGAYVFHDIPHMAYEHFSSALLHHSPNPPHWLTAAIALPCTYLLAFASYTLYETRFLKLKDRWVK